MNDDINKQRVKQISPMNNVKKNCVNPQEWGKTKAEKNRKKV